jgi:hypothetical protein
MANPAQRAHKKRRLLNDKDYQAIREGIAIETMRTIGPVQSKRLRKTHGEKHRTIG